ncbi:MAG: extracellular solute-binding protein [Actinobacteria bacterium]|nr:extracellular solute-binding protein [Actinomycetota bacterium]
MSNTRMATWSAVVGVAALSLLLTSCSSSSSSSDTGGGGASAGGSAAAAGDWSQECSGTALSVIAEATANSQILEGLLPDFKEKTGIDVTIEQAPYDSLVQKAVLDFTGNKGAYDVLSVPYEYLGAFAEKNYLANIDDMVATAPTGVGSDFSTADIIPSMWKLSSNWKDHWYGMPSNSAVMMMFFRKDLMENADEQAAFKAKYGYDLAPAKTWQQYKDIAEFFTRPAGATLAGETLAEPFYGVTLAGKRHVATVLEWMNYAWGQGGDLFNADGQPALNSPENITALEYEQALTKFAPPGYTSATWDETTAGLQQGTAAEAITWGDTAGAMEDTESSKVVGKMGYASIPTATEGGTPQAHLGSWTWALNNASQNQACGRLFMAWALSKPVQKELATGGGLPSLTSTFNDPELISSLPYWGQELVSLNEARQRPRLPQWSGISDIVSLELSRVLSGQAGAKDALDEGQAKFEELMQGALPVTYQ